MAKTKQVDPDAALKNINPVLDALLGVGILALLGWYSSHCYATYDKDPNQIFLFLGCIAFTMGAIVAVRSFSGMVGKLISDSRTGDHIAKGDRNPLETSMAMKKFKDQAWQLAIHGSMSIWEIRLFMQNPNWFANPETALSCPGAETNNVSDELNLFFVLQLSIWLITGISCKWFEERRKDYVEMMVHHILTVGLICIAQIGGEAGIGMLVLACHDTSDVVLDLMKMANYLKIEGSGGFFLTEIFFVLNTYISWPVIRLYVFPFWVIHTIFYGYQTLCTDATTPTSNITEVPTWILIRTAMLSSLLLLHILWWYLLNRIGFKMIMGKAPNKAGEEEYEGKDKKTE